MPSRVPAVPSSPRIGTLREGALHADLREWYFRRGDRLEVPVDGYVVDLVRGAELIEFQTGSFSPLRRKLQALLARHRVHVVVPIVVHRFIVRMDDSGELASGRRSPKRGRLEDVFARLVSTPGSLAHAGFTLEAVLVDIDEIRVHRPGRAYRRRGWVVASRALRCVHSSHVFATIEDATALLPRALPEPFGTAELAAAAGIPRRLAQQMLYCLTALGATAAVARRGNAILYRRVERSPSRPIV
jgi:hypothetical protein